MSTAPNPVKSDRVSAGGATATVAVARNPQLAVAIALLAALLLASYSTTLGRLVHRWSNEADYSHGFLVPLFAGYLLWLRRDLACNFSSTGRWLGIALLATSGLLRVVAGYFNNGLLDPLTLLPCLAGIALTIGGLPALRWSWPSIVFLIFMMPLPSSIAGRLSGPLQRIATVSSTYLLQTLGIAAISSGNVIWLTHGKIGVVEACSGLRMLIMFGAVTVGAVFVLRLQPWEKVGVLLSSVAIALVANVFRITLTGVAHELLGPDIAESIFHDFAGWIMMPLAMLLLWLEVVLFSRILPPAVERVVVVSPRAQLPQAASRSR